MFQPPLIGSRVGIGVDVSVGIDGDILASKGVKIGGAVEVIIGRAVAIGEQALNIKTQNKILFFIYVYGLISNKAPALVP